jgi:hypothetical protein
VRIKDLPPLVLFSNELLAPSGVRRHCPGILHPLGHPMVIAPLADPPAEGGWPRGVHRRSRKGVRAAAVCAFGLTCALRANVLIDDARVSGCWAPAGGLRSLDPRMTAQFSGAGCRWISWTERLRRTRANSTEGGTPVWVPGISSGAARNDGSQGTLNGGADY